MNRIIKSGYKYLTDKHYRFIINTALGFHNRLNDEVFLKKTFQSNMGYSLNLENPKTFNEKLQWLKLYDHRPEYTIMVDKYLVKDFVAQKIGREHIIPTIGVWDDPKKIDFDSLPDKFVLKCNHNSGTGMCICNDKASLDIKKVRNNLAIGMHQNYYLINREWPYKNVQRKIIAEKYLESEQKHNDKNSICCDLIDYKIMCFNGEPKCVFVCSERFSKDGVKVTIFDLDWKILPFERVNHSRSKIDIPQPKMFAKMLEFSRILSKGIPFLRVDFYEVDEKAFFGELTFFPGSGMENFTSKEWDIKLGSWLTLPEKKHE